MLATFFAFVATAMIVQKSIDDITFLITFNLEARTIFTILLPLPDRTLQISILLPCSPDESWWVRVGENEAKSERVLAVVLVDTLRVRDLRFIERTIFDSAWSACY